MGGFYRARCWLLCGRADLHFERRGLRGCFEFLCVSFDQLMVSKAVGFVLGYAPAAVVGDQGGN
jgi:hypothetical protein